MNHGLNLMTTTAKRRAAVRAGIRSWLRIYIAAAIAMCFSWSVSWWDCQQTAEERASLERQYEPVQQTKRKIKLTDDRIAALQNSERIALALAVPRPALSLVGMVSSAAENSHGDVYIQHFDVRQGTLPTAGEVGQSVLVLRGIGRDDSDVTQFVEQLRSSEIFAKVELKSTMAKKMDEAVVREFHVECSL